MNKIYDYLSIVLIIVRIRALLYCGNKSNEALKFLLHFREREEKSASAQAINLCNRTEILRSISNLNCSLCLPFPFFTSRAVIRCLNDQEQLSGLA